MLAIGMAANTAVFSVVNPLLLKPLPFPDADRRVWAAVLALAAAVAGLVPARRAMLVDPVTALRQD